MIGKDGPWISAGVPIAKHASWRNGKPLQGLNPGRETAQLTASASTQTENASEKRGLAPCSDSLETSRENGTGTIAAKTLFSSGKPIALQWSQSLFHDSLFTLSINRSNYIILICLPRSASCENRTMATCGGHLCETASRLPMGRQSLMNSHQPSWWITKRE